MTATATPHLELRAVTKHYGAYQALTDVDVSVEAGRFVTLIGPSGCGKSTLLRAIAGLETITAGEIAIAGRRMNDVPPRSRDVAMVFQSYALYPHMNVRDNMTYALRLRRRPAAAIAEALSDAAGTLGLGALLARFPRELSGGQRQRVAMGRAIVRHPKLFLFDEPLSNLDAELRVKMRSEIRSLHERLGATSVYVTHDQIEAMTMADHVVVLRAGRIEQQGAPLDLYDRPANRFVAGFIGSPAMNVLPGRTGNDGASTVLDATGTVLPLGRRVRPDVRVQVGLRPEHLAPVPAEAPGAIPVTVRSVEATGAQTFVHGLAGGADLSFIVAGRTGAAAGTPLHLGVAPASIHLFDAATEAALRHKEPS